MHDLRRFRRFIHVDRKDVIPMHAFPKRISAFLLMIMLLFSGISAHAEFSQRYTALMENESIQIELGASFDTLSPLSAESLIIVNDWLSRLRIHMSAQQSAQRNITQSAVTLDGKEVFGVSIQQQPGYTLTAFSPSGGAYLTDSKEKDALSLISGGADIPLSLTAAADLYAQWAPELYPLLSQLVTPKASKTTTSIKNAAASASYENYTFKADEMNAAWPQILSTLLPALEEALIQQPHRYQEAESILSSLVFSGECRFKRFLDKQGNDMGLQFTGNAAIGDDVRKVTLFGGYTPGIGGYISLALPAVKGKNNFKITFTGKLSQTSAQNTLSLESTFSRNLDGESYSSSMTASLKNVPKKGNETWSGKITFTEKQKSVTDTWTLTPALTFTDAGLQGDIAIRKKEGENTVLKGAVTLHMQPSPSLNPAPLLAAKDLRGMKETHAHAVAAAELIPLTGAFMQLIAALPEESRILLTHDLRTSSWMNGPAPDPSNGNAAQKPIEEIPDTAPTENPQPQDDPWIVEEDPWAHEIYWTVKEDTQP